MLYHLLYQQTSARFEGIRVPFCKLGPFVKIELFRLDSFHAEQLPDMILETSCREPASQTIDQRTVSGVVQPTMCHARNSSLT